MPAYVIANIRVTDPERYEDYKRMAPASLAAFGARYIARGGRSQVLEGDVPAERMVIAEFPSYEAALAWHGSADYAPAKELREQCAECSMFLVEGVR